MSKNANWPDFEVLVDWLENRITDQDVAARVAEHVAQGDPRIRGTVDWLGGFLHAARAFPLHEPPPIVRQSLAQCFARWSRPQAFHDRGPQDLHARLVFDSRHDLALAGLRSGGYTGDTVHLAYTTDEADLVLDVYPVGDDRVRLEGQVLPSKVQDAPIFEASLTGASFAARTVDGDDLSRFSLQDVPAATCQLRVSNGMITVMADLDLGSAGDERS